MDGLHRPTVIWVSHIGLGRQSNGTLATRKQQVPNCFLVGRDVTSQFGKGGDSKEEPQRFEESQGCRLDSKYRKVRFPTIPPK